MASKMDGSSSTSRLFSASSQCPVMKVSMAVKAHQQTSSFHTQSQSLNFQKDTSSSIMLNKNSSNTSPGYVSLCHINDRSHLLKTKKACASILVDAQKIPVSQQSVPKPNFVENSSQKSFDYESFYAHELEKKKKDKSYRYFNNINRIAQNFPTAFTGTGEHVTVWCSNDYLGMSKHEAVTTSMKNAIDMFGAGAGGKYNLNYYLFVSRYA
jgi:5-aminolevulinate synthase